MINKTQIYSRKSLNYKNIDNVIILAAGEGKRLRPYTNDIPKGMITFYGKPLIEWQLRILSDFNIENISLVGGYKSHKLKPLNKKIILNDEYFKSNMIWSLYKARNILKKETVIAYGDILYTKSTLQNLITTEADIAVVVDNNWMDYWKLRSDNPIMDAESLKLSFNNSIICIGQKIDKLEQAEGQYMGLIKLGSKGFTLLNNLFERYEKKINSGLDIKNGFLTDFLQYSINSGLNVKAVLTNDVWVEIDTVQDYLSEVNKSRIYKILFEDGFINKCKS